MVATRDFIKKFYGWVNNSIIKGNSQLIIAPIESVLNYPLNTLYRITIAVHVIRVENVDSAGVMLEIFEQEEE